MDPALLAALGQNLSPETAGSGNEGTLRALVELLAKVMSDNDDDDEEKEAELIRLRRRTWKKLSRMQQSLAQMSRRNTFVAGALGACECWGMDHNCPLCDGRGTPGAFEPAPAAFEVLVVPLLRRRDNLLKEFLAPELGAAGESGAAVH